MRITTNAILRNYKSNLATSMSNLDVARTQVMTQRKFNSTMEDPSSALRAAVLNRKYARNEDFLNLVKDIQSYQDAQEDAAMQINNISLNLSKHYGIEALNGTNGSIETRKTYSEAWRGAQESILLSLNASYEEKYVFAGSDGMNPPFRMTTDANGKQVLLYRNVDVTTGNLYKADGTVDTNNAAQRLEELSKDSSFVDLGFGLTLNSKTSDASSAVNVDASSAFNISLPGINLVGFGEYTNADGTTTPKNMLLLIGEIANTLKQPDFDYDKYKDLLGKFDERRSDVLKHVTTLGTNTEFLTTTADRLQTNEINLTQQIDNVVNVDMAEAIMNFSWAQYAYNSALKVGNNILTPSFIDFMN
ncbi:MAG: hypothetical protein HFG87_09745 [Dorea sp.]|nr:hypothetical protein [Dorea sp.]